MKHAFYILLSALALLLVSSCKKNQDADLPTVEGRWRYIGQAAPTIVWASDSSRSFLDLNNNHYEKSLQDAIIERGTYELLTVSETRTGQQVPGIRFEEENSTDEKGTYTISFRRDTLILTFNEFTPCGMKLFYKRYNDVAK